MDNEFSIREHMEQPAEIPREEVPQVVLSELQDKYGKEYGSLRDHGLLKINSYAVGSNMSWEDGHKQYEIVGDVEKELGIPPHRLVHCPFIIKIEVNNDSVVKSSIELGEEFL